MEESFRRRVPVCLGYFGRYVSFLLVYLVTTVGKTVVADQIYRSHFRFAGKNCENNKHTDFATLFLVLQQRKIKMKIAEWRKR